MITSKNGRSSQGLLLFCQNIHSHIDLCGKMYYNVDATIFQEDDYDLLKMRLPATRQLPFFH